MPRRERSVKLIGEPRKGKGASAEFAWKNGTRREFEHEVADGGKWGEREVASDRK
jgi:hypothetical protein